ncbi:hypothetical protein [Winogradskyella ursingii]|uniref:hypothetical protein n=1 Tax=Winogradskyella ursingii TaxID=2686079 RepID=UPI0015C73AC9|nr:hypothetical protein [Winogradskyella ursingii]
MNKKKLVLFLFIALSNCSDDNRIERQNLVFNDIFQELIKNSVQDYRKVTFPNPEQINSLKKGKDITKKSGVDQRKMLVVINDSIKAPTVLKGKTLSNKNERRYKFNFDAFLSNTKSYKLISNNQYNKEKKKLEDKYYFGGFIDISNITFETNLKRGYFTVNYRCGKLCGQKSKIYIEEIDGEWVIYKTELVSLS